MSIKAQLEKLSKERNTLLDKAKELLASAQDAGLSDEQEAEVDQMTASAEELDGQIKELLEKEQKMKSRLDAINGFDDHSDAINAARGIHIESPPARQETSNSIPARCRRHGKLTNFTGDENGMSAEERAFRFGQWALAKITMDMPGQFGGRFQYSRQFAHDQFGLPTMVHGEGSSDTSGAHVFVPDEFGTDLIKLREIYGVARGVFKYRTMSSDTRTDPRRTGGLTAYFVGENAAGTESDAAYDQVTLTAKKLMAITRMSSELNEDSVIDFGNELAGEISYAFANKEDECAFNGDGTSTYGGIVGLRTQLDTLTAGTAPGLIQGAGATWASLTLQNFEDAVGALPQYADVPGQVYWICHKTFFHSVMHSLMNAAGGNTSSELAAGGIRSYLGYPVRFSQVWPSATASGHIPVVIGNYMQVGCFGDRRMETISFSDQATVGGQSLWERDQMAVKGTQRFDINIHDFGSNTVAGPVVGIETQ